jgi:hypothetical protein
MNEADQHHPARMTIFADCFGGLQKMLDLGQVSVRIAVVDQLIQVFRCLPNVFFAAGESELLLPFAEDVVESLPLMIGSVKLRDTWVGVGVVLAKFRLRFPSL